MSERRTGLGRGIGALIPDMSTAPAKPTPVQKAAADAAPPKAAGAKTSTRKASSSGGRKSGRSGGRRPVDVFFPDLAEGKGRGADGDLVEVPGASFAMIRVDLIEPNPQQPRSEFDEQALQELAASIKEVGLLQPIVVREQPGSDPQCYELVMGERRWRAGQLAGLAEIPAIIRATDDQDLLRDALLENLHRAQLNPLEEAAAYQQLLDDFGCTQEELATKIARSRPQISNTLRLLKLPPLVQRRLAAGVISAGHARALLSLPDVADMERLAARIVAEGLSVRSTEEIVALGDATDLPPRRQAKARPGQRSEALDALAERLSDRFDTRVRVGLGQRKGRLVIEFASVADLNRILGVIDPQDPGVLR